MARESSFMKLLAKFNLILLVILGQAGCLSANSLTAF